MMEKSRSRHRWTTELCWSSSPENVKCCRIPATSLHKTFRQISSEGVKGIWSLGVQSQCHYRHLKYLFRLHWVLFAARRIFCWGFQTLQLWRTGSEVVALGLNCSVSRGILVPWPGVKPVSLLGVLLATGLPGQSPTKPFWNVFCSSGCHQVCVLTFCVLSKEDKILC